MKKIVNNVMILILAIIFSFNMVIDVYAAPKYSNVEDVINTKTYDFSSDVIFTGAFSSHTTYFNIDKWWKNSRAEAKIDFSINQLISKEEKAYIKLSVNGTPFYSEKILYKDDTNDQQIKVSIPKDLLREGINEFKIETYLRVTELPCVDDVNLANWFVLKKDSNIKVTFNNIIPDDKISNFPYPYLKNMDATAENSNSLFIVIPDDYSDGEISAAFILYSYLEKLNDSYNNKIQILKYGDLPKDKNDNSIFIGRYSSYLDEIDGNFISNTECLIKMMDFPYASNNKKLFILCDDDANLIKGIKTLQNKNLVFQLDNNEFYIKKDLKEDDEIKSATGNITFKEIGVDEIQFKGAFRRQSNISYSIPKSRIFSTGDNIKIFMRYSENLDFDKSLVTVYINNTPIGSKKLEKEKASQDELEINIPRDACDTNYLDIKIAFDLELKNTYCEKRQEDMPWALVTGDSYLYLGEKDVDGYFFSNYGVPFVKNGMFNDVAMVVPDELESQEVDSLGKVISYLGRDVSYNNGDFKVVSNKNINETDKNKNLIIYGTPITNNLISSINDELWFKYNESFSKFLSNEKLELTDPFSSKISNIQFDISRFNNQKAMLVLTSPNNEILKNSLMYLSSSDMFSKLNGDCAIVNEYGEIKTYKMKKETKTPAYETIKSLDGKAKGILVIIGLFVLFVAAATILYIFKNNKSKEK